MTWEDAPHGHKMHPRGREGALVSSASYRLHLWAVEPGTSHFPSLNLSFFVCKTPPSTAVMVECKGLRAQLIVKVDSFKK